MGPTPGGTVKPGSLGLGALDGESLRGSQCGGGSRGAVTSWGYLVETLFPFGGQAFELLISEIREGLLK